MLLCFISLITVLILPLITSCPPQQQIYPCTCANEQISCSGLENEQVLSDVVYALKTRTRKLYSFAIKNSHFMFIPHDIFTSVVFQEFQIVESSFMALTDTDIALEGLEEHLASLVITDSDMLNAWDWMALKNLKKLLKLHIDVDLGIVSEDIEQLTSVNLKDISLAKNKITYVHEKAFSNFKELLSVSLRSNLITEIKRSMFSNPAPMLWKLDLGYNQIQTLSTDMFENMPSLEVLIVESNKLMTLTEGTFKSVWRQLTHFDAMDNHLRCDCRMTWITQCVFPKVTNGVCEQPKNLQWKKLQDLKEKDLWCLHFQN